MTKEQYLEQRNALMNEAQDLLNRGELAAVKEKRTEIETLDADFENISKEQANLKALEGVNKKFNMENQTVTPEKARVIDKQTPEQTNADYETVFSKVALQRPLNQAEIEVYNRYNPQNAYTHSTVNTEIMIPETTIAGIIKLAGEQHPILTDVRKLAIKGVVRFVKHTAVAEGDAKYYTEAQAVEDEKNTFGELTLGGHELAKAVTVTWKLQSMAVNDFIPFLQQELAERIGAAKAYAVVKGTGTNQPTGIVTALKAQSGTPQVETYTTALTYQTLTAALAKISAENITGAKVYCSNNTVWNVLANLLDKQDNPIFISDPISGGVGRLFGKTVHVEDALADGEIIIGNVAKGYVMNVQEGLKLVTEQHAKQRTTDFVGYEVNDGNVLDEKAFVLIEKSQG